jgi:transcriptional regulator with XRE-family HTH domain
MAKLILARILKKKRLSKREFARRTGIRYDNVSKVFHKDHNPSLETLTRYAKAVGVKVRDILDE